MYIKFIIFSTLFFSSSCFDERRFFIDHCRDSWAEVTCSNVKFSAEDQDYIQKYNNFSISGSASLIFKNSEIQLNGAFFEKFPQAQFFAFENCKLEYSGTPNLRQIENSKIYKLNFKSSNISKSINLKTLVNLERLTFENSDVQIEFRRDFLKQFPKLYEFNILYCTSIFLYNEAFQQATALKNIQIHGQPNNFYSDLFLRLDSLERLDISNNKLDHISTSLFPSNLQYLGLHNNDLRFITANMFKRLSKLQELHLQNNQIEHISSNAFKNLTDLRFLYLMNNNITIFTEKHLQNLERLRALDISNNNVTYLDDDIFDGLINLEWFKY